MIKSRSRVDNGSDDLYFALDYMGLQVRQKLSFNFFDPNNVNDYSIREY